MIAAGFLLSLQDFVIPDPSLPWEMDLMVTNGIRVVGAMLASLLLSLFSLRYILPNISSAHRGPYLHATLEKSHAYSTETAQIEPGAEGTAKTFLRPSGKMQIDNELYDVIADGDYIAKGTPIVVHKVTRNRIVVRAR